MLDCRRCPLVMGAGYADGSGYGLRNGTAGAYDYSEFSLGVMGRKTFSAAEPGRASKSCDIVWATPLFLTQGPLRYFSVGHSDPVCPWNIEGAISLGYGLRVGLNLAELVDFTHRSHRLRSSPGRFWQDIACQGQHG
jgi:hypothetical protein